MTLLVREDISPDNQRKLFTLLGTDFTMTPLAWVEPVTMVVVGILIALIFSPANGFFGNFFVGIIYGILLILTAFMHSIGHVLSSLMANAPVDRVIFTATVATTHYNNNRVSGITHLLRASGGPLMNLMLGVFFLLFHELFWSNHFVLYLTVWNILYAIITVLPVQSFDGEVILREVKANFL